MEQNLRLSVSKTKTFLSCKAKYKFAYIEKLPQKDRDYTIFGKFCHKVLEDFHMAYINGSEDPYNIVMSIAWKDAISQYKESMTPEMKKDCWKIIDQYLKQVTDSKKNKKLANVIACEKTFALNIEDKVLLNGMIDRIQIDSDGVVHVCDYKTSKSKKYQEKDNFQLLTYAYYILKNEMPDVEKIRGSYIMMRHDFEYLTTEFSRKDILKIEEQYLKYADQILNEKEFDPNPTVLCGYCDFINVCEAGQKQQHFFNGETNYE